MRIHFIGIGGIGISALAQFCLKRGDRVTGSDVQKNMLFPVLQKLGAKLFTSQKKENVPRDTDLVVYSEAVEEKNPERRAAQKKNIPQKSYFEYLGEISKKFRVIAVCGTHGKTTTTAMLAQGFLKSGFDVTAIVGTTIKAWGNKNFHAGTSGWLLVEACEYRNNFQFLRPEIVILTDLDYDHPDSFESEEAYYRAFSDFCAKAKTIIFHENEASRRVLFRSTGTKIPVQDTDPVDLRSAFGKHNERNARLAIAAAKHIKVDTAKFLKSIAHFQTPGRRQEFLGEKKGVKIYDDYAHHPEELRALFSAFREKFPGKKLAVIFEPHQFARTIQFFDAFVEVLKMPDVLGICPIYAARDSDEDRKKMPTKKLIAAIQGAIKVEKKTDVKKVLLPLSPGDVLVFVGAGNVSDLAHQFVSK